MFANFRSLQHTHCRDLPQYVVDFMEPGLSIIWCLSGMFALGLWLSIRINRSYYFVLILYRWWKFAALTLDACVLSLRYCCTVGSSSSGCLYYLVWDDGSIVLFRPLYGEWSLSMLWRYCMNLRVLGVVYAVLCVVCPGLL